MIYLEAADALSRESVGIQAAILNSQPRFNLLVIGKEQLTSEEIVEENMKNLEMGENILFVKDDHNYVGLINYLPRNSNDQYSWIGLLIIHSDYEQRGLGTIALNLLEEALREQGIVQVRLAVQHGNDRGAAFWQKNGFIAIRSCTDNHNNQVDVYEKPLL